MEDKGEVWEKIVKKHGLQVSLCLVPVSSLTITGIKHVHSTLLPRATVLVRCSLLIGSYLGPCTRPTPLPQDTPYKQLVTWEFTDFVLTYPGDMHGTVQVRGECTELC